MPKTVVDWPLRCQKARQFSSGLMVALAWSALLPWNTPVLAQTEAEETCEALNAVGGETSVSKFIQLNNPLTFVFGRTNFNTDFTVTNVYQTYWVNFQSDETEETDLDMDMDQEGAMDEEDAFEEEKDFFPVVSYLKFSDHSNLKVFGDKLLLDPGEYRRLGPFYPPQGKLVTEVNVKVGSSSRLDSSGLRYTISVDGCF